MTRQYAHVEDTEAAWNEDAVRHALRFTDWSSDNDRAYATFKRAFLAASPTAGDPRMDYERREAMLDVVHRTYGREPAGLREAYPTTSRELFHGHHPSCGWTVDADPKACNCVVALATSEPAGLRDDQRDRLAAISYISEGHKEAFRSGWEAAKATLAATPTASPTEPTSGEGSGSDRPLRPRSGKPLAASPTATGERE